MMLTRFPRPRPRARASFPSSFPWAPIGKVRQHHQGSGRFLCAPRKISGQVVRVANSASGSRSLSRRRRRFGARENTCRTTRIGHRARENTCRATWIASLPARRLVERPESARRLGRTALAPRDNRPERERAAVGSCPRRPWRLGTLVGSCQRSVISPGTAVRPCQRRPERGPGLFTASSAPRWDQARSKRSRYIQQSPSALPVHLPAHRRQELIGALVAATTRAPGSRKKTGLPLVNEVWR